MSMRSAASCSQPLQLSSVPRGARMTGASVTARDATRQSYDEVAVAPLTLAELERVARGGAPAPLSAEARARLVRGRETVDAMVADGTVVYGVTTGLRRSLVGADRRGGRRAAAAQPRALARDRRRRAAAGRGRARDAAAARQQPLQGPLGRPPRARRAAARPARARRPAGRAEPRLGRRLGRSRAARARRGRALRRGRGDASPASASTAARRCGAPGSRRSSSRPRKASR